MKNKLSDKQKLMAESLKMCVTYLPGSYDKRFAHSLAYDACYTDKQVAYIEKCFHKYRRQIPNYNKILNHEQTY